MPDDAVHWRYALPRKNALLKRAGVTVWHRACCAENTLTTDCGLVANCEYGSKWSKYLYVRKRKFIAVVLCNNFLVRVSHFGGKQCSIRDGDLTLRSARIRGDQLLTSSAYRGRLQTFVLSVVGRSIRTFRKWCIFLSEIEARKLCVCVCVFFFSNLLCRVDTCVIHTDTFRITQFQTSNRTGSVRVTEHLRREERETNKMQLIWCLLSNYLNMFRASLCPSSGEQEWWA